MTLNYQTLPFTVDVCPQCRTQLAPSMLACPGCGRLVHAERLQALAETARQATERGEISNALAAWREALDLLPRDSRQYQAITAKITELGPLAGKVGDNSSPAKAAKSPGSKAAAGLGAFGLLLWKLKTLFLGLTKATTFFTMLLSLGFYWKLFGWKFGLGLVLSIYVHEMGHVIALRRLGFKATSPMFIPGLGALIRLQQQVVNPAEDAIIGLAGPIYGLGAAIVSIAIWYFTRNPIFAAIAGWGAWINLFNLLPVWTLDGGRGFHAMSRQQKLLAAITVGAAYFYTHDQWLILIGAVGLWRSFSDKSDRNGNWNATLKYIGLALVLSALALTRQLVHR